MNCPKTPRGALFSMCSVKNIQSGEHLVPAYLFEGYHQGLQQLFTHTLDTSTHTPVYAGQLCSCESEHALAHASASKTLHPSKRLSYR